MRILLVLIGLFLTACSSGGGGDAPAAPVPVTVPVPEVNYFSKYAKTWRITQDQTDINTYTFNATGAMTASSFPGWISGSVKTPSEFTFEITSTNNMNTTTMTGTISGDGKSLWGSYSKSSGVNGKFYGNIDGDPATSPAEMSGTWSFTLSGGGTFNATFSEAGLMTASNNPAYTTGSRELRGGLLVQFTVGPYTLTGATENGNRSVVSGTYSGGTFTATKVPSGSG